MYVYEEVDEYEEDEYESKKSSRRKNENSRGGDESTAAKKATKRNYTKEKVSLTASEQTSTPPAGSDIRTAFLRSSMVPCNKPAKTETFAHNKIDQDELANEIMQELSRKSKNARPANKPANSQNIARFCKVFLF